MIEPEGLAGLSELGLFIVSDEIYHGLVYGESAHSMREYTDWCAVVNGPEGYLRLSYAAGSDRLEEGLERLGRYFG